MKSRGLVCLSVVVFSVAFLCGSPLAAQNVDAEGTKHQVRHHRYRVIDIGTFGGPNSDTLVPAPGGRILNSRGEFIGAAETAIPDPYTPNCFNGECLVEQTFRFDRSVNNLGALPGTNSSIALGINEKGAAIGISQNGLIDPLIGVPELEAVLWHRDGRITDLGTLGGNGSSANAINNSGQVFGGALNTIPDPYSGFFFVPGATQVHAFLWEHGSMMDLGTLGGPDSAVFFANDLGQAAGASFTNDIPNATTGVPTTDPFFWQDGKMVDIGTFGGTLGQTNGLNARGQVVGFSKLDGDQISRPFLWQQGRLKDLGTLGGDGGEAWWLNDVGHVVGRADLAGSATHHAFLWKHEHMKDLGTPHGNPCSTAEGINSYDQVVGDSGECEVGGDPFLWENGGPVVALSDLTLPGSDLTVFDAFFINDRGEIACLGATSEGNVHACILIPTGRDWEDSGKEIGGYGAPPPQSVHPHILGGEGRRRPVGSWRH